jgi:alpha-L-fucosidase
MEYSEIRINGHKVHHFHYNDYEEQLEAYDESMRTIVTYSMDPKQWAEISKLSYAACWEELGRLFGDVEEENE